MDCKWIAFDNENDWLIYRAPFFTSSKISKLLTEPKKKTELLSVGAKTYIKERIARTLAVMPTDFKSIAMERGNEKEPEAVKVVAEKLGKDMSSNQFLYTSDGGYIFFYDEDYNLGATPDVILFDDKMTVQIKCPNSATHLDYLLINDEETFASKLPDYYAQMQLEMYLTNSKKGLFVSFDDRFYDDNLVYHSLEISRNDTFIELIKSKAKFAKEHKDSILKVLRND